MANSIYQDDHTEGRRAPKNQRRQFHLINPRGTDNRLTGKSTFVKKQREQNTTAGVKITENSGHFEFTGATIGEHTFPQTVFQKSLDEVFEQYKRLRAQGRQPTVDITGLASSSLIPGKGSYTYASERANEIANELMKRGIPKSAINIESIYGPHEDPRSISSQQKSLQRGAVIDVKRASTEGFYDERKLTSEENISKAGAIFKNIVSEMAAAKYPTLGPREMHDRYGRIGRLTVGLIPIFDRFYREHEDKLTRAGLPSKNSDGSLHNNSYNGSFKNAFRHTIWQALGSYYLGLSKSKTAADYKDSFDLPPNIKENQSFRGQDGDRTLSRADTTVDLLNNEIGRGIGIVNYGAGPREVCIKVLEEARDNGLWIVESIEDLGTAKNHDFEVTIKKHQLTSGEFRDLKIDVNEFFKDPKNSKISDSLDYDMKRFGR